ncbi:hypothetical protein H0H81_006514, partial [Sphagnurus paluster]
MSSAESSVGVAIVTGAARGIGRAIALCLAKDGYDVGLNDLPTSVEALEVLAQDIIALGRRPYIAVGDISIPENVENMVSTVVGNLGQLNVMVANVGIIKPASFLKTRFSEWEKQFSVNAFGTFLSYKYTAKQMIKQGKGGRIIGASSIGGKQ